MSVAAAFSRYRTARGWEYPLWISLAGLCVWSYGFNNVPLVPPVPLVDVAVAVAVAGSFPLFMRLPKPPALRIALVFLTCLSAVALARLAVDVRSYGLLAVRDALFVGELWILIPAFVAGYRLGPARLTRVLHIVFGATLGWFLLYPWRDFLMEIGPVFGLQRPVPLFAFTSITVLSATLVYWYVAMARGWRASIGAGLALLAVLMAQSRGMYLATLATALAAIVLRPVAIRRHARLVAALGGTAVLLALIGQHVAGWLGEPVGLDTALAQLATLLGEQGPGAGSYEHRIETWPIIAEQVFESPLGPWVGVGLGRDLFLGFAVGKGVLVRKPHNDFLEIWARFGVAGLLPWLGILVTFLYEAAQRYRLAPRNLWILALQISLWIVAAGQPAMAFAYVTVVWAILTGLWIGALQASVQPTPRYLRIRPLVVRRPQRHSGAEPRARCGLVRRGAGPMSMAWDRADEARGLPEPRSRRACAFGDRAFFHEGAVSDDLPQG